jgi:hypothetical protein
MEQATQPQTLGYGLADSPVGLLAWIYEKLVNWTDSYPWDDDEGTQTIVTRRFLIYSWLSSHLGIYLLVLPRGPRRVVADILRDQSEWRPHTSFRKASDPLVIIFLSKRDNGNAEKVSGKKTA